MLRVLLKRHHRRLTGFMSELPDSSYKPPLVPIYRPIWGRIFWTDGAGMTLKQQLKQHLLRLDMTAAQLARKSGVSKSVLSDWLAGASPRDINQVKKVATALGTTVDNLCFGDGEDDSSSDKSDQFSNVLGGDDWIGGIFEIRVRRVKRSEL